MAACLILLVSAACSAGELVTEVGGGWKFHGSDVTDARCLSVRAMAATDGWASNPPYGSRTMPCGGRNPLSVIWPLAWDFPKGTRIGWFHMSGWADGPPFNDRPELTINCLCATFKHSWTGRK